MNEHTTKQFDVEMEAIRSGVLAMGGLVETQFRRAVDALRAPGDVDAVSIPPEDRRRSRQRKRHAQATGPSLDHRQPVAVRPGHGTVAALA